MKRILLISCTVSVIFLINLNNVFAYDYKQKWYSVDSLEYNNLSQSALKIVLEIYEISKTEKNDFNFLKALNYRYQLENKLYENSENIYFQRTENEIINANEPLKSVLSFVLANDYWNYYKERAYKISKRTQLDTIKSNDVNTWDLRTIHQKVLSLFDQSISKKEILKMHDCEIFKGNLIIQNTIKWKAPSLYDYIAYNILSFYTQENSLLTKPVYEFYVKDTNYLKPFEIFKAIKIETKDLSSHSFRVLKMFQELINTNLNDTSNLIMLEYQRIKYVYNHLVNIDESKKDSIYLQTLDLLVEKYKDNELNSGFYYLLADYHYRFKYQKLDSKNQINHAIKSIEYCTKGISLYPKGFFTPDLIRFKNFIIQPSYSLKIEENVIANQPFIGLLTFENIDTIYYKIYEKKLIPEQKYFWNDSSEYYIEKTT